MDIRILPSNIANMIAAGEVVQRPASVVKELVENALDAFATKITVCVQDAGRTVIQVIDNGCGMSPDQAVLCFERHATSKIHTAEDLQAIETFGFRGEALASIAAVAEVTLKTRTADADLATQVSITDATANDPGRQDITQVAAPVGSNFIVRNLFYNTPARRKFLKSDAAELKQIISEFIKLALSRIDVAFLLTSNGKDVYNLPAVSSLKLRIRDIFGTNTADDLLPLNAESVVVQVNGFISRPDNARRSAPNQYFFVNGRFFRCPYLHKAVIKAYENLVPDGANPSYFLYLDIDPHKIDVNVHPTKTEIKFEDDSVLFTIIMASVREALGRGAASEGLDFDRGNMPEIPSLSASFEDFRPVVEPGIAENPTFNPFDNDGFPNERSWERELTGHNVESSGKQAHHFASGVQTFDWKADAALSRGMDGGQAGSCPSFLSRGMDGGQADQCSSLLRGSMDVGQAGSCPSPREQTLAEGIAANSLPEYQVVVKGRYMVLPCRSGVMFVDSQRAMQRLLYDEFLEALSKENIVAQARLFPLEVEVGAANMVVIQEYQALLSRLGFEFSPFSENTMLVNAVPDGLLDDRMTVSALVYEVITALSEERDSLAASLYGSLAQRLSLSASRTARIPTDVQTARALAVRLFRSSNPEYAPDGHKIVCTYKMEEMEKLFR